MAIYQPSYKKDANTMVDMVISADNIEKDTTITSGSSKPITSGAVYTALQSKAIAKSTTETSPSNCIDNGFYHTRGTLNSLSGADSNPFLQYHPNSTDFRIITTAYSGNYIQQIATDYYSNHIFYRTKYGTTWNDWQEIAKISDIPTIPTKTSDLTNDSGFITSSDIDQTYNSSSTNAQSGVAIAGALSPIAALAEGKTKSYVIQSQSDITGTKDANDEYTNVTAITGVTIADLALGDIILIKDLNVPDYWVSQISPSVSLNKMETTKVDLTDYVTKNTAQTISGEKTFTSANLNIEDYTLRFKNTTRAYTDTPNTSTSSGGLAFRDKNNVTYASINPTIGNSTNNLIVNIVQKDGASRNYIFEKNAFYASASDSTKRDLGLSTMQWKDLYLSGKISNGTNNYTLPSATGTLALTTDHDSTKQDTLVSGTNIKTINNESILGSGNISISTGQATDVQINGTSIVSNNVANVLTNGTYNASTNKIATMSDVTDTFYATCTTAAATKDKVATISGSSTFTLRVGVVVGVKFTNTNTFNASATAGYVTLNVNNTGAKNIYWNNTGTPTGTNTKAFGYANRFIYYMYDGTYWVFLSASTDDNSTGYLSYTAASVGNSDTNKQYLIGKRTVASNVTNYYNSSIYFKGNSLICGSLGNGTNTYMLPSAAGTLALTSDIPSGTTLWNTGSTQWAHGNNVTCKESGSGASEWSFDCEGTNSGTMWHVWSSKNSSSILQCYPYDNRVVIPNGNLKVDNRIICKNFGDGAYTWDITSANSGTIPIIPTNYENVYSAYVTSSFSTKVSIADACPDTYTTYMLVPNSGTYLYGYNASGNIILTTSSPIFIRKTSSSASSITIYGYGNSANASVSIINFAYFKCYRVVPLT